MIFGEGIVKGYTVFNIEQIDNLPAHYYATAQAPQIDPAQRIAHAEQFLTNTGAAIVHRGNRAFYSPDQDRVTLPPFEFFQATMEPACTKPPTGRATPHA